MDIIAAHQQGLIERVEEDARALSGRAQDHCQRAVVLHHLYSHSRSAHEWALAEALREVHIAKAFARLTTSLDRWGWSMRRRGDARAALAGLGAAIGESSRARCASAFGAYRLTAATALRLDAERLLTSGLCASLRTCHGARRTGRLLGDEERLALWNASEALAASVADNVALEAAWTAVEGTALRRMASRMLGEAAMSRAMARDRKRGWATMELALCAEPLLPSSFRANPAQHFYSLQHILAQRRRQKWREACDREPGAFERAA